LEFDPLNCEQCLAPLEPDDAVSIIEGRCPNCRAEKRAEAAEIPPPLCTKPDHLDAPSVSGPSYEDSRGDVAEFGLPAIAQSSMNRRPPALSSIPAESPTFDNSTHPISPAKPTHTQPPGPSGVFGRAPSPVNTASHSGPLPSRRLSPSFMSDTSRPSARIRRRHRDLGIGIAMGLLATIGVSGYFLLHRPGPSRSVAGTYRPSQEQVTETMALTLTPPWAKVTLNGKELGPPNESGKIDVTLPMNDAAVAWLEVSAEGYHSIRRPLSTLSGVANVTVELVPMPFQATIRTTPSRAEVWIDNELKGYSPVVLTLPPTDSPTVIVKYPGYAEVSRKIEPPGRGEAVELEIPLQAANVIVQVQSEPPGAMIAMDGIVRGPTPLAVEMDPSYLGKDVEISATLAGYEAATTQLALPAEPTTEPVNATLTLTPQKASVEIWTTPPGGRVLVNGKEAGTSPVTVKFDAGQIGGQAMVSATLGTSYFGKQEITVPPLGELIRINLPMEVNSQRVILILSCPMERAPIKARANAALATAQPFDTARLVDRVTLTDQLVEVLHALSAGQQFAVLIETDDGIESWPGGLETEAATQEQKVRAYDIVRAARPLGLGRLDDAFRQALNFDPDTIWLFTTGDVPRESLDRFSDTAQGQAVTVHVVRTKPAEQDDWLRDWTARRQGTLTIVGRDKLPTVAMNEE
jgi:hypothetical protein